MGTESTLNEVTSESRIEAELRRRWLGHGPLAQLVPATRVHAGWVPVDSDTYCAILLHASTVAQRTSSGTVVTDHEVRFHVVAETLDVAERIANELERCLNRRDWPMVDSPFLLVQRMQGERKQHDDGRWQLIEAYLLKEQHRNGGD